jgi:hypothetical protein
MLMLFSTHIQHDRYQYFSGDILNGYVQINKHTYTLTYIHTYIHTYIRTYIHTYIPTYIHTYHGYIICRSDNWMYNKS